MHLINMTRKSIIALSVCVAIFAAFTSITTTLYISWIFAETSSKQYLQEIADRTTLRATRSFEEGYQILQDLQKLQNIPCSNNHIEQMRKIVFNSLNIEEVGYFENGFLKCTSWGPVSSKISIDPPDFIDKNNVHMYLDIRPIISQAHSVISLLYESYNLLINPVRFTDIITDPGIQIALVLNNGKIVSQNNNPDPEIITQILENKYEGMDQVLVSNKDNISVVVIEPRKYVIFRWYDEIKMLLPLGLLIMFSCICIIVWLTSRRLSPLGVLKSAISKKEFMVHYQPLNDLNTGVCIGAEALIRWERPDGSWERPDSFITLAENNNLIRPITEHVVNSIINDVGKFLIANKDLHISVNISATDFKTGHVLDLINDKLSTIAIKPEQIWLEITEQECMNIYEVKRTISKAREMGYSIAIDDFGTGYSSLSYLQDLPLNAIKIDKTFVDSLLINSTINPVIEHIISIAKTLQLTLIAEGIETQGQADYLRKHGVEYAQGWFFAKAMPANEFMEFYINNKLLSRKLFAKKA